MRTQREAGPGQWVWPYEGQGLLRGGVKRGVFLENDGTKYGSFERLLARGGHDLL